MEIAPRSVVGKGVRVPRLTCRITSLHKMVTDFRKLALVGIIPYQILFSFSSDKDRRTDSRIRQKTQRSPAGNRTFTRSSHCGFVAQWLERATRKTLGSIPGGAALLNMFFRLIQLSVLLSLSELKEKRI